MLFLGLIGNLINNPNFNAVAPNPDMLIGLRVLKKGLRVLPADNKKKTKFCKFFEVGLLIHLYEAVVFNQRVVTPRGSVEVLQGVPQNIFLKFGKKLY